MFRFFTHTIVAAVTAALITACSDKYAVQDSAVSLDTEVPALPQLSHNDSLRFKVFYIEAIKQQIEGNYDASLDLLNHCLTINPNAAEAYYNLAAYNSILKSDTAALEYLKKAATLSPKNNTYLESLASGYARIENYEEAISAYEQLSRNSPKRSDVLQILSALYTKTKDYDNMVKTINRIEELEGSSEKTVFSKMLAYSLQGKKGEEFNTLKQMADKHPNDLNYRVMIGNWLLQNGKTQEAYNEYTEVLRQEPDNNMAMMSIIDYYKTAGQQQRADSIQESMLLSRKTPLDSKVSILRQIIAENENHGGDSTKVLDLFKRLLSQPQKTADMAELYAAYMQLKKMPQDSVSQVLEATLADFPDNVSVRMQLISNIWDKEDFANVIELSRQGIDYNPDKIVFYYYLGLACIHEDNDEEALDAFQRGVKHINRDTDAGLASVMYGIIGDLLHGMERPEEAYAAYDSCLQWKDDNYEVLNNYAYYLCIENHQLAKAEQMSYRTVQAEPDNSTFLDTYAWILFMQKKYKDAQQFIDMAVKNDTTNSSVILEHAGDIHAMNGETDTAVSYWKKALETSEEENKVLIRKIKLRKYINEK